MRSNSIILLKPIVHQEFTIPSSHPSFRNLRSFSGVNIRNPLELAVGVKGFLISPALRQE